MYMTAIAATRVIQMDRPIEPGGGPSRTGCGSRDPPPIESLGLGLLRPGL